LKLAPQTAQPKTPAPDGFVSVSFEINKKGLPINIQVDKSSDKELEDEVIALIREWRFEAVLMGDVPDVTHARVELSGSDPSAGVGRPRPHRRPSPAQQ
jgi:TonB family protein